MFCFVVLKVHLPLCIQGTPFQQQFAWQIRPGRMSAAAQSRPLPHNTCHQFLGFFSDIPANLHTPCTP